MHAVCCPNPHRVKRTKRKSPNYRLREFAIVPSTRQDSMPPSPRQHGPLLIGAATRRSHHRPFRWRPSSRSNSSSGDRPNGIFATQSGRSPAQSAGLRACRFARGDVRLEPARNRRRLGQLPSQLGLERTRSRAPLRGEEPRVCWEGWLWAALHLRNHHHVGATCGDGRCNTGSDLASLAFDLDVQQRRCWSTRRRKRMAAPRPVGNPPIRSRRR